MKSILLGSGLGSFVNQFEIIEHWPYTDFVDFDIPELGGHERVVYKVAYAECEYLILSGKLHYYESQSMEQMTQFYKNLVSSFEIESMLITASSGALSSHIEIGKWYQVGALIMGNGIVMLDKMKSQRGQNIMPKIPDLNTAVYSYQSGPSLGSLAEYKMLYEYGSELVGMSILPEWQILNQIGIDAIGVSIPVCNYAPLDVIVEPSHEEVMITAAQSIPELVRIFKDYIKTD